MRVKILRHHYPTRLHRMMLALKNVKQVNREQSGESQKRMSRSAEARIYEVCHTFSEIQSGPNPLTKAEIEKLI